jgi:hypothetical protein
MNIIYELGQQSGTNTIMLIPSSMPEAGWPPIGTYGFKELPTGKPGEKPVKKTASSPEPPMPEEQQE